MFGQTGGPQKRAPKATECLAAARHFLACGLCGGLGSLWRVTTFKRLLGAARHSLAYIRLPNSESHISSETIAAKLGYVVTLNSR